MDHIDSIDTEAQSVTATICEQAQVYGATPERGELDPRVSSGTRTTPWRRRARPSASSPRA